MERAIDFLVLWGPTILLLFALISGIVLGLIRGFRKSLILFIHSIAAFAICLIAYLIVVNMDSIDEKMVSLINSFMGSDYALQEQLEVSKSCVTMRDILVEFIPKNMDYGDGFALIVAENGNYLATLVDLAYHIILALFFVIVYHILVFILYIIYLIFYPEGRYRAKKNRKFRELESENSYKKRSLLGAAVGGGRALISSIITLSFIGSLLFVLAGGEGNRKKNDFEFGDDNADTVYSVYQSIRSYGTEGIFKILNSVKNPDDVPYYLFAADIVFQGDLFDPNRGIDDNVIFRSEFGSYFGFAEDTFDLLLEYGGEDIRDVILDRTDEDVMDVVVRVMSQAEFQDEFGKLIDDFDGQTYFINFSLSLVDSIVNYIDETEFGADLGEDSLELINILFKKGYLSDKIPAEKEMKEELASNPNANLDDYVLPYINATSLLTKDDTKELVKLVLSILQIDNNQDNIQLISDYSDKVIPSIANLSILSNERKNEINPVLNRLYQYLENTLIKGDDETNLSYTQAALSNGNESIDLNDVNWIDEINMLLEVAEDLVVIIDTVYDADNEIYELLFDIFKEGNENAASSYDSIMNNLAESDLLGLVLSSSLVYDSLEEAIPDIVFLEDITYTNKVDENGEVVLGEISNLLTAIKIIASNPDNKEIISKLMDSSDLEQSDLLNLIGDAINNISEGENSAIDYVLSSKLVQSIASAYIIGNKEISEGIELYIPTNVLEINSKNEVINVIKSDVLVDLVKDITSLLPEDSDDFVNDLIINVVKNKDDLLDNTIVLGTVVNFINSDSFLTGDMKELIIIPSELKDAYNNLDTIGQGNLWDTETINLFNALDEILGISTNANFDINDSNLKDDVLDSVMDLNANSSIQGKTKLDVCYDSLIIQNTLSNELDNILEEEIEAEVLNVVKTNAVYNKSEIKALINAIKVFDLDINDLDIEAVKDKALTLNEASGLETKLDVVYKSLITKYMISKKLYEVLDGKISSQYISYTGIRPLVANGIDYRYYEKAEVSGLITAVNAVLDDNQSIDDIDIDAIKDSIFDIDVTLLYKSFMVRNELTTQIDDLLSDQNITQEIIDDSKYQDINGNMIYKIPQIDGLIGSLKAININNADQLSEDITIDVNTLNTENAEGVIPLDVIYESDIIVDVLTTKVDDMISDKAYDVDYRLQAKHKYSTASQRWLYNKEDIVALVDTIQNIDLEEFDASTFNDMNEIKRLVNDSVIIQAIASKTIVENNQLIVSDNVKDDTSTLENSFLIKLEELNSLFDFLSMHSSDGLGTLDMADFNPTLTSADVTIIKQSSILSATIAQEILDNETVYVPFKDSITLNKVNRINNNGNPEMSTNNTLSINNEAVASFINSIVVGFGVNNVRVVDSSDLNINDVDLTDSVKTVAIKDSSILRATITNGIKIDNPEIPVYALSSTATDTRANDNNYYVYILSGDEIIKIIQTVQLFGSSNGDSLCIDLTFENIKYIASNNSSEFESVIMLDVVRMLITQILLNNLNETIINTVVEPKMTIISSYDIRKHDQLIVINDVKNNLLAQDIIDLLA